MKTFPWGTNANLGTNRNEPKKIPKRSCGIFTFTTGLQTINRCSPMPEIDGFLPDVRMRDGINAYQRARSKDV